MTGSESTPIAASAGFKPFACITPATLHELMAVAERHALPVANLVLLCVQMQLQAGDTDWDTAIATSGMPTAEANKAATALFTDGWFSTETGVFAPPGLEVMDALPRALAVKKIRTLDRAWADLWYRVVGESLSGPDLVGGINRYLRAKSKALPEPDPELLQVFLLLREAASIDTFLDDIANYLPEMRAALSADILASPLTPSLSNAARLLRKQYALLRPGWSSNNIYLFYYLAMRGVVLADMARAIQSNSGVFFQAECLKAMAERPTTRRSGVVNLSALNFSKP